MILDRLERLSMASLRRLAHQYEVDVPGEITRDELIELVIEAIEENRAERESVNANPVSIGEKKYELFLDELEKEESREAGCAFDGCQLPSRYNETRVVLLLRDPAWAYAYWDIHDGVVCGVREQDEYAGLCLRVFELAHQDDDLKRATHSFDIPIGFHDTNWYINLPTQNAYYRIELICEFGGIETVLSTSNTVLAPPVSVADNGYGGESVADKILSYSDISNIPVDTYGSRIPQRIMSLLDE
jgi:uncharacterized protein